MAYSVKTEHLTEEQAEKIRLIEESHFADVKAKEKSPKSLTEDISAFANADGGDLYIGISNKERIWEGFPNIEAANGFLECFDEFFPIGPFFHYQFLQCDSKRGLVLHVHVLKTQSIFRASNKTPYVRLGAQSIPVLSLEKYKQLEYNKGSGSFESELIPAPKEIITESSISKKFINDVIPSTQPEPWLKKERLLIDDKPTVAGILLFAEEPQAVLQKNCGVKISRYKTIFLENGLWFFCK
jgi:ATP-dependent DNA helicase RecG